MKTKNSNIHYDAPLLSFLLSLFLIITIPLVLYVVSVKWSDSYARLIVVGIAILLLSFFALKKEKYYLLIIAFIFLSQFAISLHSFELTPPALLRISLFDVILLLLVWTTTERKEKWNIDKLGWLFITFILWELVISGYSAHLDRSIVYNLSHIKYLIIYLIALNMPLNEDIINKIPIAFMLIVLIQATIGLLQYIHGGVLGLYILGEPSGENLHFVRENLRITGTIGNTNSYAGYMAEVIVFLIPFLLLYKKKLLAGILFLGCMGLLLSFSRAGWLSLFIGGLVVVFMLLKNKLIRLTKIIGMSVISIFLLSILIFVFIDKIMDRFQSHEAVSSAQSRIEYTKQSFDVIKDYPIFGIGPGITKYFGNWNDFQVYIKDTLPNVKVDNMVHNGHLQIWMEGGTPAFIIWLSIVIYIVASIFSNNVQKHINGSLVLMKIGSIAAAITVLIHVSFGTEINQMKIMSLFWFFLGLNRNVNHSLFGNGKY